MRGTTLRDVADRVGVSPRTVSRAVNGEPGLSVETRARVLAAVDDMGYQPNMLAKGLRANRTNTIGLVVTDLSDPFFPGLAQSIQEGATERDHTLVIASTRADVTEQGRVLSGFRGRGVDGLVIFPASHSSLEDVRRPVGPELPLVVIDDVTFAGPRVALVDNDLTSAAHLAVEHLVGLGHRRIAMLTHAALPQVKRPRTDGFRAAMARAGLSDEAHVEDDVPNVDGGRRALQRVLRREPRPTAIFAYNDLMAIGALHEARAAGLTLPDDLSVVGVDDIDMAELVHPPLTTVRIDRRRLGRTALERVLLMISDDADPNASPPPVVLDVDLVVRGTTAQPSPQRRD